MIRVAPAGPNSVTIEHRQAAELKGLPEGEEVLAEMTGRRLGQEVRLLVRLRSGGVLGGWVVSVEAEGPGEDGEPAPAAWPVRLVPGPWGAALELDVDPARVQLRVSVGGHSAQRFLDDYASWAA